MRSCHFESWLLRDWEGGAISLATIFQQFVILPARVQTVRSWYQEKYPLPFLAWARSVCVCVCVCIFTCMCFCVHTQYVWLRACLWVCIRMYLCMYIRTCVCMWYACFEKANHCLRREPVNLLLVECGVYTHHRCVRHLMSWEGGR